MLADLAICEDGGVITLGATPIGNLGDVTDRLREALSTATVIAAEDTRVTIKLMRALGIEQRPELVPLHEHNERQQAEQLVARAAQEDILLLTDAGMPTVSDPGFVVVRTAVEAGVAVTCLPGPSAVTVALALSGLPTDRFAFDGFAPRKAAARQAYFTSIASEQRTVVLFESPHRLADTLESIAQVLPDRQVAVCRELTKRFEEVRRGTAAELLPWAREGVKGEIAVVIAGGEPVTLDFEAAAEQVRRLVAEGERLKDAAAQVAAATGHGKRDLYQAALS